MYYDCTTSSWVLRAPAKLNLFFEVLGKRADGYHEIESLALPIRLSDTLTFRAIPEQELRLRCYGAGEDVPCDDRNIVIRALRLIQDELAVQQGAEVTLWKRIPSQAGLGGGSSDAAAAIRAAHQAWNLPISISELQNLSAKIGSDCPIFFYEKATISRGRGEVIEPAPWLPSLNFVILKPSEGLSTAEVYKNCMEAHDGKIRFLDQLFRADKNPYAGTVAGVGEIFFNRLEAAAERIWPRFSKMKQYMKASGCLRCQMSGSGTAFFGLCRNRAHAGLVAARLRRIVSGNADMNGSTILVTRGY